MLRGDRNREMAARRLHRQAAAVLGSQVSPYGWDQLRPVVDVPEGATMAAENGRCRVIVMEEASPMGPPDKVVPLIHLAIAERGRPLIWEEVLQVIREVVGFEAEGVELYPALRRELRGERHRHIYVVQDAEWPVGMVPPIEARRRASERAIAEQISEELKRYVVLVHAGEDGVHRVFRDAADATGLPEGATLREALLAALPTDRAEVVWSPAAVAYRGEMMADVEVMRARLTVEHQEAVGGGVVEDIRPPEPTEAERAAADAAEAQAEAELRAMRAELAKD
jgi:hypothetical protein